ncbi:hypothetical protein H5410_029668 [Solanum commersonii]|uniref:Uncharacterized protein n=1 Tax=Solanum commersonii TaxID=4109 RepID=A0A9J5YDK4_SOLCO|nr:hypothetical protein H5410_029668 [Solanum commersonii]
MAVNFEYHHSSLDASLTTRHIILPRDINNNNNTITNYIAFPLVIQFRVQTIEQYRSRDSRPHHEEIHTKSLCLNLHPSIYLSFYDDTFYKVVVTLIVDLMIEDESFILQSINRMEVDEDIVKDDCVICLEELGMKREFLFTYFSWRLHHNMVRNWSFLPYLLTKSIAMDYQ